MNYKLFSKCLVTMTLAFIAITNIAAQDQQDRSSSPDIPGEEIILQWNRVLAQTLGTAGQHPGTIRIQRSYAMMHLAMYDAVNSIDGGHQPYLTDVPNSRASTRVAAAYAAHGVLSSLYPTRQAVFDAELADSLVGESPRRTAAAREIGLLCAQRMLANRANDGWNVTPPAYVLPTTPGNWQPTPPANAAATLTHFRGVTPFVMAQHNQYHPVPPPALTSAEYAAEVNEIKSLGAATGSTRTPEQTQTAQLWASGPVSEVLLNDLIRNLALSRNLTTPQNARLFALYYMSLHDALQTTNSTQYTFGRWRPITAIRRADEDGNPDTVADPAWTSLVNAPATPTYASNASALTSAPATMLALFFGRDDIPFQINFGGTPNVIRSYRTFSAMTDEAAFSRILAGIHFRSDTDAGQAAGRNVSVFTFMNYLRVRECKE